MLGRGGSCVIPLLAPGYAAFGLNDRPAETPKESRSPLTWLDALGALSALGYAWLTWASHTLPHTPLAEYLTIVAVGWACLLGARKCAGRLEPRRLVLRIWIWACIFRLIGWLAPPPLDDDHHRYLWDGYRFAVSGNPYATTPLERFDDTDTPAKLMAALDGINNPDVPTIYGPVCQYVFLMSYLAAPGEIWPLKLLLILADLLTLRLLLSLTQPRNALIYAWCPLVVIETAFSAHPDSLGVLFVVAAVAAHRRRQESRAAAFLGVALAAKVLALLAAPFLLWKARWRARSLCLAVAALCYLPFLLQGSAAEFPGLAIFARQWEFNSSIYAVAQWALGSELARFLCAAAAGLAILWLARRWNRSPASTPPLDLAYGLFFLLATVVNPWYLLWLAPFVALRPSLPTLTALAAVSLAYLTQQNLGASGLVSAYEHPVWVRPLEYGLVLAAAIAASLRPRPFPSSVPTESALNEPADSTANSAPKSSAWAQTMVVMPALDEAGGVEATVTRWRALGVAGVRVVDNGSRDATPELAAGAGAEVLSESRRGFGAAAWRGTRELPPAIEWLLFCSADGSDRLEGTDLKAFQARAEAGDDLIMGDRTGAASQAWLKGSQRFGNWLSCFLIRLGWGREFRDMGSLRLIRRSAFESLELQDRRFGWNVEMNIKAIERGLKISELPVTYFPRDAGSSKISGNLGGTLRAGRDILGTIAALWMSKSKRAPDAHGNSDSGAH